MHQTHAMAQVEVSQQSAPSWLAGYPFKLLHLNAVVGHAGDVPVVVAVGMERLSSPSPPHIDNDGSNCCTRVPQVETVHCSPTVAPSGWLLHSGSHGRRVDSCRKVAVAGCSFGPRCAR